jgi:capsular exopolysaccharide synthesis family protein
VTVSATSLPAPLNEGSTSMRAVAKAFWRWKWLFLLVVVVTPLAAYLIDSSRAKVFTSAVVINVQTITVENAATSSSVPVTPSGTTPTAITEIIHTLPVAALAAPALHQTPNQVLSEVTVSADPNSGFIVIAANAPSGQRAHAIAAAYARAVVANRASQAVSLLNRAIRRLSVQLAGLPRHSVSRNQLSQQIQQLRALRATQGDNAQVIAPPTFPAQPSSPHPQHAALLAFLLAIFVGFGVVFAAENLDRRIRELTDVEELTGLSVLSALPRRAFSPELRSSDQTQEAFRMLRAGITYFNVDRAIQSILVASPMIRDGKTTVAANLAESFARTGQSVLLLDADLRRPRASTMFGLETPGPGLCKALIGEAELDECLREVQLPRAPNSLTILPAGKTPPNPSELIGSHHMQELLDELSLRFDVIVIDTSPALTVPDAIPLFRQVSGILLVAKVNSTSKDSLRRLQRLVLASEGRMLGVVATGLGGHAIGKYYGYTSKYGYGHSKHAASYYGNGNGPGRGRLRGRMGERRRDEVRLPPAVRSSSE